MVSACSSREVVVVYSPHGPDVGKDYEKMFEEAHPNIDLQWIDSSSQDVFNRVSSEKNRPQCDVWWGGPSTMFMQAAKSDLLAPYTPSWSEAVGDGFKDPKGMWHGTYDTPLAIMFNNRKYTRETVPQSWDELLDDAWADKITIRAPIKSGTMRTFIGSMILREGGTDEGIAWLGKLHKQTRSYMESPQLMFDHLKRNEELITVWIMPDAVLQRERNGYPFDSLIPADAPVLTEGIAIIKNAPHRGNAELFYEFVTTKEALAHQANEYAKIPTRSDIDTSKLPAWMGEQTVDAMDIDWEEFAENEQDWIDRWKSEVYDAK
jgi:iron(III) transport system substrate-binding protein